MIQAAEALVLLVGQAVSPANLRVCLNTSEDYPISNPTMLMLTSGPRWLRSPEIANLVARTILAGCGERQFYELYAWVVMPNHVHLLILPKVPVAVLMRWLKGSTARHSNQILGRTGQPFWQDESMIITCVMRVKSGGP